MAAAGVAIVDSHSSRLTVKRASTTKIDNAMACPLVLTGSMAAVATAAICRPINSLSDKLPASCHLQIAFWWPRLGRAHAGFKALKEGVKAKSLTWGETHIIAACPG